MKRNLRLPCFRNRAAAAILAIGLVGTAQAGLTRTLNGDADSAPATTKAPEGSQNAPTIDPATGLPEGAAPKKEKRIIARAGSASGGTAVWVDGTPGSTGKRIVINGNGATIFGGESVKDVAWLGISTEEPDEALSSQLGLQPGEGLLVTFVATNSPASKAGLQKNDLLMEMDGQKLLLPAQLRKLVRMHKEGDKVEVSYYRAGKKQNTSATLGLTKSSYGMLNEDSDNIKTLHMQLQDLGNVGDLTANMKELERALARAGVDREKMQADIQRGAEQARKAVAEAMARVRSTVPRSPQAPHAGHVLEDLALNGVEVDDDATVTIKSRNDSTRTIVKTDESGSYVIVADPAKRLTAHDKSGKMLFDGEIESKEQQDEVPRDVWKKVEPMVEQLNSKLPATPLAPTPPAVPEAPAAPRKTSRQTVVPDRDPLFRSSQLLANIRTFGNMLIYMLEPEPPMPAATAPTVQGTNVLALAPSAGGGV